MKCPHCGNNLNIEDAFCAYCGKPNDFAAKHRAEMDRYEKDFRETRETVLEQSAKINSRTVKITMTAVLVALIAVCCVLLGKADDIRWWRMQREIASQADTHRQKVEQLMEERDYQGLYSYLNESRVTYSDVFREYDAVYSTTLYYRMFYGDLMTLQSKKSGEDRYSYLNESELLEDIAQKIHAVYENMEPAEYNAEAYQGDRMAYMEDLRDHMEILVAGYFGISPEEAAGMRDMTTSRIGILLEENYENEHR